VLATCGVISSKKLAPEAGLHLQALIDPSLSSFQAPTQCQGRSRDKVQRAQARVGLQHPLQGHGRIVMTLLLYSRHAQRQVG
jgi:hypothetical protein